MNLTFNPPKPALISVPVSKTLLFNLTLATFSKITFLFDCNVLSVKSPLLTSNEVLEELAPNEKLVVLSLLLINI